MTSLTRAPLAVLATEDQTVAWYDRSAKLYFRDTIERNPTSLREAFIARLPANGRILDAGSGSGRDTLAFLNQGFDVDAFDASRELAVLSSRLTGRSTRVDRFETYQGPPASYDGVWAFASLLHVREQALPDAIDRLANALKAGGWLFANFKAGTGERLDGRGRRYTDLTTVSLTRLFASSGLWGAVETVDHAAVAAFGDPTDWVDVFAQRRST